MSNEQSCTCPAFQHGTICAATSSVKVKFTEKVRAPAINMSNQEDFRAVDVVEGIQKQESH